MKRKIKLYILRFKVFIKKLFTKKENKVAILVSSTWKNKVSDDLLLVLNLLKNNIYAEEISYDKEFDYKKYNLVVIRSIWGYEKNLPYFENLINTLEQNNIKVLNKPSILKDNYNKEKQLSILDKYNIPHIKTTIIEKNTKDIENIIKNIKEDIVIKPTISASGNNTYLISKDNTRLNTININEVNNIFKEINKNISLMIQPFIKEIDNGELSIIYTNGKYTHSILRYPNIFNNKSNITYIPKGNIDIKAIELSKKVLEIKEYKDNLYERIDMVKIDNDYYIMEIELVEPDLFIRNISDNNIKTTILNELTNKIIEELK